MALLLAAAAQAQVKTPDGRIAAHDVTSAYSDGRITVSMQVDATKAALHRTEAIVLTPVIRAGGNERALPPVVVGGSNRRKADRRAARFHGRLPYNAATVYGPAVIPYKAATAYEPWMAGAELALREDIYGCALRHTPAGSVALAALRPAEPVKPSGKPAVTYLTPAVEAVKNRRMGGEAFLDFPAGRSVILGDFRNNSRELGKIRTMLDGLRGDKAVVIDSIVLRGYASPEGSYAVNQRLSGQRADALRSYLQKAYGYPASMFHASSGAEDWEGLKTLVGKSDIAGRDAILAIIDGNAAPEAKEQKLKALGSYPELLKNYFPQLRRVEYRLCYTVRAFSVDEGKEKLKANPALLSLNEMFLVANTYPKGSEEFNRVFDVAVRMFPADTVANLNEAAMLLERGDAASARRYLEPFASHPGAWNNLGVLYLLTGDYAGARMYLDKVAATPEAAANLRLLTQWEQYAKDKETYDRYGGR